MTIDEEFDDLMGHIDQSNLDWSAFMELVTAVSPLVPSLSGSRKQRWANYVVTRFELKHPKLEPIAEALPSFTATPATAASSSMSSSRPPNTSAPKPAKSAAVKHVGT